MIGTIATRVGGRTEDHADHATTPEAPELQAALRAMADAGDRVAVVETTSHGLALDRVASVAYDVAILTNVTHEHLELHGTWEAYRDAKLSLFDRLRAARGRAASRIPCRPRAIVNLDDPSAGLFVGTARDAGATRHHLRHRARRRRPRDARRRGRRRSPRRRRGTVGRGDARPPPRGPVQRPQRARGGRPRRGARPRRRTRPRGPGRRRRRAGPDGAHRRRPAVRRRRRLRAQPGVARRPCSTCSRRPPPRAAVG